LKYHFPGVVSAFGGCELQLGFSAQSNTPLCSHLTPASAHDC
jgi:hypothetical protein